MGPSRTFNTRPKGSPDSRFLSRMVPGAVRPPSASRVPLGVLDGGGGLPRFPINNFQSLQSVIFVIFIQKGGVAFLMTIFCLIDWDS